jgi:hypothetical protein
MTAPDADHSPVRLTRRTTLTAALVAGLLGVPAPALAGAQLSSLQAELAAATARTEALSTQVEAAAARDGGLRVAVRRLDEEHARAQARLDAQVRRVWIHRLPDPIAWSTGLGSPALRRIAERGAWAAVSVDRDLVSAVSAQSSAAVELRAQAEAFQVSLRGRPSRRSPRRSRPARCWCGPRPT